MTARRLLAVVGFVLGAVAPLGARRAAACGLHTAGVPFAIGYCDHTTCTRSEILAGANGKLIDILVANAVIDRTWLGTKVAELTRLGFTDTKEWLLIYRNERVADATQRELFVFVGEDGIYKGRSYAL